MFIMVSTTGPAEEACCHHYGKRIPEIKSQVNIQVGLIGDAQVGKTSLVTSYIKSGLPCDKYTPTSGINFLQREINLHSSDVVFSFMDLGGQNEFLKMLPLAAVGSSAIILLFDLMKPETFANLKEWYRQVSSLNSLAVFILVGTKYDLFIDTDLKYQREVSRQALEYAHVIDAPLIFSSAAKLINVEKVFKVTLAKIFNLNLSIPEIKNIGDPLLVYKGLDNCKRQD